MIASNSYTKTDGTYVGAGIILMRFTEAGPQFLMLKGRRSCVWSFPKGHPEDIDKSSPLRTAVRETQEETGLVNGRDYTIIGDAIRFGKRPYWLGIVHGDPNIQLCWHEHIEWCWMSRDEIDDVNANTDVRAWVKKTIGPSNFTRLVDSVATQVVVAH